MATTLAPWSTENKRKKKRKRLSFLPLRKKVNKRSMATEEFSDDGRRKVGWKLWQYVT